MAFQNTFTIGQTPVIMEVLVSDILKNARQWDQPEREGCCHLSKYMAQDRQGICLCAL